VVDFDSNLPKAAAGHFIERHQAMPRRHRRCADIALAIKPLPA